MMKSFFVRNNLSPVSKICLAGLFMAVTIILQKVLAVNYIPIVPFLRISLGGPAIIIFASILLGPWYGLLVGIGSDVLGYLLFDPRNYSFFPTITLIYAVLGFLPYFLFSLFKRVHNKKISLIMIISFMTLCILTVTLVLWLNNTLTLYQSVYTINLLIRLLIPGVMIVLFAALLVFIIFYDKRVSKRNADLPLYPIQTSFSLLVLELFVMVIFGSLMKAVAFGFQTFWVILFCQIIVMFINVPLNTIVITILIRVMSKHFLKKSED